MREAGGHQQFGAVAQHHQRQLEADLHPAAGEEDPATAEVRAQGAAGGVVGGAPRAQAVVEGVDLAVGRLADVAAAGLAEHSAGTGRCERSVLAPVECAGRGRSAHLGIGGGQFVAACPAPAQPSVPREGRGDLLGAQPDRVVDGQCPQAGDRTVEGGQLLLADCVPHVSPPVPMLCRWWAGPDSNRRIRPEKAVRLPLRYRPTARPGDRIRTGVSVCAGRRDCLCATPGRAHGS